MVSIAIVSIAGDCFNVAQVPSLTSSHLSPLTSFHLSPLTSHLLSPQVLCSLLLGVGYDAYVVSGYAPRAITHCDQSAANFPATDAGGAKQAEGAKEPSKYVVRPIVSALM